ncbi:MAG: hypothetical protein GWM91_02930, partial [Actinobacteria bacterium]|nr:hypothetical protein [Actinomycetota bacterium]NIX49449.1 hypothetical protein [Actinomycetota bacterium]
MLAAGRYYVAIAHWANDANAAAQGALEFSSLSESGSAVTGATPDASFNLAADCEAPVIEQCVGAYQLQIRTDFMGVADLEGDASSGQNDASGTAQLLGDLEPGTSLTSLGWIDQNNVNDVDFWQFTLTDAAGVHFDVDFAEDVRTDDDDDVGLDPELWVFDADGRLIANNDDSDFFEIGGFNAGT